MITAQEAQMLTKDHMEETIRWLNLIIDPLVKECAQNGRRTVSTTVPFTWQKEYCEYAEQYLRNLGFIASVDMDEVLYIAW